MSKDLLQQKLIVLIRPGHPILKQYISTLVEIDSTNQTTQNMMRSYKSTLVEIDSTNQTPGRGLASTDLLQQKLIVLIRLLMVSHCQTDLLQQKLIVLIRRPGGLVCNAHLLQQKLIVLIRLRASSCYLVGSTLVEIDSTNQTQHSSQLLLIYFSRN